jgi:ribosome maturation factor RimP
MESWTEMNDTEKKVRELILPLFDGVHLHLIDLELRGKSGSQVVSVYADTREGITLDEITRLTREINDLLDMHDVIRGSYRLDVSSPGIDRPLQALWEFEKNIGRNLRVIFEENNEQKEASGTLTLVNEDGISLKIKKEEIKIPMVSIIKAQVKLKW